MTMAIFKAFISKSPGMISKYINKNRRNAELKPPAIKKEFFLVLICCN